MLFDTRLEAMLSETPFHFAGHCDSASSSLSWLKENKCDVVLIDIHLGNGLNGIEISMEFKNLDIPVVFITDFPSDKLYNDSFHNNESYFLVKPFDKFNLSSVLDKIYRNKMGATFILRDNY